MSGSFTIYRTRSCDVRAAYARFRGRAPMDHIHNDELGDVARLVELVSDAVVVCDMDGTVQHVNGKLLDLLKVPRERVVGVDVKDLLYSSYFERALDHQMPFTTDGADNTLMLKLTDGSFIPVGARAIELEPPLHMRADHAHRFVVALRSLEEQYASDRKMQRLLSELQAANKRLSGTLSIIMSTVGSNDLATLVDTVLNRMAETLDASGATAYFAESGGFKLRGVSEGIRGVYVPDFIPYGAGVPTYVLREQRACRLSINPSGLTGGAATGELYDLDVHLKRSLPFQYIPPFKTIIAVPIYFGTQVLGIIELGWTRPCTPRVYDVRVLEVVCDYLSIELVGVVTSLRSMRTSELTRSLNRARDTLFSLTDDHVSAWREITEEVRRQLSCRVLPVLFDPERAVYVIDYEGGSSVDLPRSADETFFSEMAPAARVGAAAKPDFMEAIDGPLAVVDEPKHARLARVDRTTWVGVWFASHGLPCQGVYIDLGPEVSENEFVEDVGPFASVLPPRRFLLLRDDSQEPIDDLEFDYLTHMARDFELILGDARHQGQEHRIAQTLQVGMRNDLGNVPGITADSLFSSATKQALVGGDFYTLIRLPDDRAVMILGDVSGKGVEAASMSSLVKTALTAYTWEGASPARMARSLNRMLMSFSRVETFVTVFIAKLDLRHGRATYCSAGHPPTMLLHVDANGAVEAEQLSTQSGVIGAFSSMAYENGTFTFKPGDILFMYTDGAIEARDASGAFFGEDRLNSVLLSAVGEGIDGMCSQVLEALDVFTGSALDDDIALAALRFDGLSE